MNAKEHDIISNKAVFMKDGVYTYKSFVFAVKKNRFIAYADCVGDVFEVIGWFNYHIGKVNRADRVKTLQNIFFK